MKKWILLIEQLVERIGKAISWLTLFLVVLVFANVFMRYVFNDPSAWSKELEWHLFALIFIFGAAFTFKHDGHVRVDLFYDRFSKRNKASVNFWGTLLFLIPWCIVLIYTGWQSALSAYMVGERSPESGGLSNLWLIQFAIPLGMSLLLLQGIVVLMRSFKSMKE